MSIKRIADELPDQIKTKREAALKQEQAYLRDLFRELRQNPTALALLGEPISGLYHELYDMLPDSDRGRSKTDRVLKPGIDSEEPT